jgi:phosphoenolpyruvate synthase/pyruvate phosphate dikinase
MGLFRNVVVPETIFGDQAPPLDDRPCNRLTGIPTSRGCYTGPVKVVQGIRDFDKVQPGDVLAIPFSDVGWTPLFTKAGAVIAESGGILSHSSIVAREYDIPAVVSVSGACSLKDNTLVTVDGYRGQVVITEYSDQEPYRKSSSADEHAGEAQ